MMRTIWAGPPKLRRLADGQPDHPYERFDVRPLSPIIGAEIFGVDLRDDLDDETFADLRRALLEWKVIFFRDQDLTGEQHRDFARRWGDLEVHPFLKQGEVPEVVRFEKGAKEKGYENVWHSDVTWRQEPSLGSVLRAIEVPDVGGDTLFADAGAAYDALEPDIQERIDGLTAIHDFSHVFGLLMSADELAEMQQKYPPAEHPIVRVHPDTGRRTLYVNEAFTSHIPDLDPDESEALLQRLFRQPRIPELQCRFRWQPNSIAFWDNRAAWHYAASDYFPARRVMERVTIIGDRPTGIA